MLMCQLMRGGLIQYLDTALQHALDYRTHDVRAITSTARVK